MQNQNDPALAQAIWAQQQMGSPGQFLAQQQNQLQGVGFSLLAAAAMPHVGTLGNARVYHDLENDFREYMRECRREVDID